VDSSCTPALEHPACRLDYRPVEVVIPGGADVILGGDEDLTADARTLHHRRDRRR
jgi:hypothetical protein